MEVKCKYCQWEGEPEAPPLGQARLPDHNDPKDGDYCPASGLEVSMEA